MKIEALHPDFGVEIKDIDLSEPMSPGEQEAFRRIFDAHHLMLFRASGLSADDQLRLLRYLGCPKLSRNRRYPEHISNVHDSLIVNVPLLFHSDRVFCRDPEAGLSLYAEEISGPVSPTLFVSAARACDRLPDDRRREFERLNLVQMIEMHADSEYQRVMMKDLPPDPSEERYPRAVHPMIKPLPNERGAAVFASENMTSHVLDMPSDDSEALLQDIFRDLYDEARIYRHEWRTGDLLIWNNIALQHARPAETGPSRRHLRRMLLDTLHPV